MEYRPKTLVIVRHGETDWNKVAKAIRTRQMDVPAALKGVANPDTWLSDAGIAQAKATGKKLDEIYGSFDAVYYSPWLRTKETTMLMFLQFSEAARERMAGNVVSSLFLTEQNPGLLDPALSDDTEEEHRLYQKYRSLGIKFGHFYLQYAGVENWSQVATRVHLFRQMLNQKRYHRKKLLIVTHGITTILLRYNLEGLTEEQAERIHDQDHPKNCGVYEYNWNNPAGRYDLTKCNVTYHE